MSSEAPDRSYTILSHDGKAYGPVPWDTIRAWIADGRVISTTPVLVSGDTQYRAASEFPEIAALLGSKPPPLDASADIPWERQVELGFFRALGGTITGVLFSPTDTFRGMNVNRGIGPPFIFAFGMIFAFWAFFAVTNYFVNIALADPESERAAVEQMRQILGDEFARGLEQGLEQTPTQLVAQIIFFGPLMAAALPFVAATAVHLFLLMVGGAARGYEATYRAIAYAAGAVSVVLLVPACGTLIALVWFFFPLILGLREAHRITTSKAACAVLLPLVLICLCGAACLVGAVVLLAGGLAAMGKP